VAARTIRVWMDRTERPDTRIPLVDDRREHFVEVALD
jgi:hypothetical protein